MADQDIQFKVTADVQDAKQGFGEVQGKIDGLKGSASETVPVMNEVSEKIGDAGTAAVTTGASTGMLSSLLTMGLVAGAMAAGIALIGLAGDYFALDGEVKNLTASLKENWSEAFKATEEWKKFNDEIKKFNIDQVNESIKTLNEELEDLIVLQDVYNLDWTGLTDIAGEIENKKKQLKMLGGAGEKVNREEWERNWFGMSVQDMKDWFFSQKEVRKKAVDELEIWLKALREKYRSADDIFGIDMKHLPGMDKSTKSPFGKFFTGGVKQPKNEAGMLIGMDADQIIRDNQLLIETITSSAMVLRNEFMQAWEDIFGEANSLFEKLLANITEKLATSAFESLAGSFLNFIVPGLGTAVLGKSSPGSEQVINLQLDKQTMATWYVGGKNQANRLRMG